MDIPATEFNVSTLTAVMLFGLKYRHTKAWILFFKNLEILFLKQKALLNPSLLAVTPFSLHSPSLRWLIHSCAVIWLLLGCSRHASTTWVCYFTRWDKLHPHCMRCTLGWMTSKPSTMGLEELHRNTWASWAEFGFQLQSETKVAPLLFLIVMFTQAS